MTKAFLLNLNKKALFFYTVFLQSHTKRDCLNLLDSLDEMCLLLICQLSAFNRNVWHNIFTYQ